MAFLSNTLMNVINQRYDNEQIKKNIIISVINKHYREDIKKCKKDFGETVNTYRFIIRQTDLILQSTAFPTLYREWLQSTYPKLYRVVIRKQYKIAVRKGNRVNK